MANLIEVGDIYEVRIVCEAEGQVAINRLFYRALSKVGQGGLDTSLAALLDADYEGPYKDVIGAAAQYVGVSVQRAFPAPRTLAAASKLFTGVGLLGGNLLPTQTCGLISLRTDFAGKSFRGRKYIPFPADNGNTVIGDPTAAQIVAYDVIGNVMLQLKTVAGPGGLGVDETVMDHVIWRPPAGTPTPVANFITRTHWATQRRRGELTPGDVLPF